MTASSVYLSLTISVFSTFNWDPRRTILFSISLQLFNLPPQTKFLKSLMGFAAVRILMFRTYSTVSGSAATFVLSYRFKADLTKVGKTIEEREKKRNKSYPYLQPKFVPNAISV